MTAAETRARRVEFLRSIGGHVAAPFRALGRIPNPLAGWDPGPRVVFGRAVLAAVAFLVVATTTVWGIA